LRKRDDSIAKQALYSGHHRAIEIEGDQRTPGKEIWKKKCEQQVSGTAGGRWRRQYRTGQFDTGEARNFKFGTRIDLGKSHLKHDKIPQIRAWSGSRDQKLNFKPLP